MSRWNCTERRVMVDRDEVQQRRRMQDDSDSDSESENNCKYDGRTLTVFVNDIDITIP